MSDANTLESVLRRVQKLLAIAGDERGNANEAAAAASQAESIMRKFQIEHADVISAQLKRDDAFNTEEVGGTMNPAAKAASTTTWAGQLSLAVARLNDCRSSWVRTQALGVCVRYSGFKSDTQVALWTHLYVVNQMGQSLRTFQKANFSDRATAHQFRRGFISAVIDSINQAIDEKRAEMSMASDSRALVLTKANAVDERFGQQKVKFNKFSSGHGFGDGHAEGQKVNVSRRGLSGGGSTTGLIGG